MTNERICIGKFAGVHGVRGLLRIYPYCEDISLFESDDVFFSKVTNDVVEIKIKSKHKKHFLAEVKNINNREDALEIADKELWISRDSLPEIDDDEYYIEDLKGINVQSESGQMIGKIVQVSNFGSVPVIEIKPEIGESFYLPFTGDCVYDVDLKKKVMVADPSDWIE